MSDWPVGLSTGCFYQTSIFDVLETIRDGGFSLIEVCSSPKHLDYHDMRHVKEAGKLIRRLGMQPFSFHAPFAEHIDITSLNQEKRENSVRELMQAAEAAAALGVLHFVIHPGPEREGKPPAEEYVRHLWNAADALTRVSRRCRKLGMDLIVENMLPHLLFGHTSDILWIIGAIDETNLGTCLDTGHAFLSGDLHTVMFKLSGHLRMIHAADNNGTFDDHFPPGRGSIDWKVFIGRLQRMNFSGAFILELSGASGKTSEQILSDAREGRDVIRETSRKIALQVEA